MEMVAAAKIRRATERVEAATPYSDSMMEMLANVAERVGGSENALLQKHDEVKNVLVVVVVSDRGLAGGFNSNVLRHVEQLMKEKQAAGAQVDIVACGKKAVGYFNYRKIVPALEFTGPFCRPDGRGSVGDSGLCHRRLREGRVRRSDSRVQPREERRRATAPRRAGAAHRHGRVAGEACCGRGSGHVEAFRRRGVRTERRRRARPAAAGLRAHDVLPRASSTRRLPSRARAAPQ